MDQHARPPKRAGVILRHYLENPALADNLEGIAAWRLLEEIVHQRVRETKRALHWLVTNGYLERTAGPVTPPVYRLKSAKREDGERFVAALGLRRSSVRRGSK